MSDSPAPYTVPPVSDQWTASATTPSEWSDGTDEALLAPDDTVVAPVAAPGVVGGVTYPALPPIRSLTSVEHTELVAAEDPHVWQLPPDVTGADLSARMLAETSNADFPTATVVELSGTAVPGDEPVVVAEEPIDADAPPAEHDPRFRSESVGVWVPGPDDQPAWGAIALAAEMGIDLSTGASTLPDPSARTWDEVMPQILRGYYLRVDIGACTRHLIP